ncbi:MAG TPA: DUF2150 family protein [Candidatus Methanoperedenaceae archaeon]|nr:DUF2150 family protein [Candidatus Methanoperedenaceae archaeon]
MPFYTSERWNNWVGKAKESGFTIDSAEGKDGSAAVFTYMEDDVILACLKVIAKFERKVMAASDALDALSEIKEIVLARVETGNNDVDLMLESIQLSLNSVFASCEMYIEGGFDRKKSIEDLVSEAVAAEKAEDISGALWHIAEVGARVLSGGSIPEKAMESVPDGFVAEWLDGVDSISAAMLGDTSYKYDEADDGED